MNNVTQMGDSSIKQEQNDNKIDVLFLAEIWE